MQLMSYNEQKGWILVTSNVCYMLYVMCMLIIWHIWTYLCYDFGCQCRIIKRLLTYSNIPTNTFVFLVYRPFHDNCSTCLLQEETANICLC